MTRIAPGAQAPHFQVQDIFGNPIDLKSFRGTKVMLSFYRYAGCPLCNLRVNRLLTETNELEGKLEMIAVFQSPGEAMLKFVDRQQAKFPFIADPKMKLYKQYGVETSWAGLLKMVVLFYQLFIAMFRGFFPGRMDGPITRMPADFLIDEEGIIKHAFYGSNIGDHMPISEIHEFVEGAVTGTDVENSATH